MKGYLGIDLGSVSSNFVFTDESGEVVESIYLRTRGRPLTALEEGLAGLAQALPDHPVVAGVGTTGSGRVLAGLVVGADVVKNEITAHAAATTRLVPDARTILEIGGQDSKIIVLGGGTVVDFAMNTVCAAGTGSFLDQQAARLSIPIEDFGEIALQSGTPVRIAGRCAVFAESDMIHKQQMGYGLADILAGLCEALVRNYLNNLAKGKEIRDTVVFQGGVAANAGMRRAFETVLGLEVRVPRYFSVMGALGAALLARDQAVRKPRSNFKGFGLAEMNYRTGCFNCDGCANQCEVVEITQDSTVLARWGDRCGKWSQTPLVAGA